MKPANRPWILALATLSLVTLTACGSGGSAASPTPAAKATQGSSAVSSSSSPAAASPAPSVASSPAAAAAPESTGTTAQKVNANTASIDQIQQALDANGVPNAARWAREVDEYRPYPTNDPSMAKLRQELAKYNPAPDVVGKIVASLTL